MNVNDFDYYLPEEYIAQKPIEKRDESKMLVLDRCSGKTEHKHFFECIDYFDPGDVLVINNTKVIPARLFGIKEPASRPVEVFLLKRLDYYSWNTLLRPGKKVKIGDVITFSDELSATVIKKAPDGVAEICFSFNGVFEEILDRLGHIPLPPYIKEKLDNPERYQTVYAVHNGSCAAPTAGLHFTDDLIERIRDKGIIVVPVLLHVGLGTFRPVKTERVEDHIMHSEFISIDSEAAESINRAKSNGKKIIAVGTTSVRVLETVSDDEGTVKPFTGETDIFIYPGYKFKTVDALITNFHLPKSTLLMLVSAFAGKEIIMKAYSEAIEKKYRFFSFGDSMLII